MIYYWTSSGSRPAPPAKTLYVLVALASLLSFPLLLEMNAHAQTSIVIRRTPTTIVVGADSKEVRYEYLIDGSGQKRIARSERSKCKIRQVDQTTFFAIAGQYDFDVDDLAVKSCKEGGAFLDSLVAFEAAVRLPLINLLKELRNFDAASYDRMRAAREPLLQIVIFGLEKGTLAYVTMDFYIAREPSPLDLNQAERFSKLLRQMLNPVDLETIIDGCPLKHPSDKPITHPLGRREAINGLVNTGDDWEAIRLNFWRSFGDVEGVRFLVWIETAAASEMVSEPIDVLSIDAKGKAEWKHHKDQCPPIEQPKPPTKTAIRKVLGKRDR